MAYDMKFVYFLQREDGMEAAKYLGFVFFCMAAMALISFVLYVALDVLNTF
jgi:hypothetical protein